MSVIAEIYRKYMPMGIRYKIGKIRVKKMEEQNFRKIQSGKWKDGFASESKYMVKKGKVMTFPYPWTEKYEENDIEVYIDREKKMPYVLVAERRLYFPKRYPVSYIRTYFNSLLMEQDPESSHYYFNPSDDMLNHTVFLDVGAAEGFISLMIIPFVDKIILFECDQEWIKALETTFEPWKDKVKIVHKYAGDITSENIVKIDDFAVSEKNIILKLDVEGMEESVLRGAEITLKKNDTRVFVCTYHKKEDEEVLGDLLRRHGYEIEKSEGYMFYGGKDVGFRKGMIRAWKK